MMERSEFPHVTRGVRGRAESFRLFDAIHAELNSRLPFGRLSKSDVFDMVVSSAAAVLAEKGELRAPQQSSGDKAA